MQEGRTDQTLKAPHSTRNQFRIKKHITSTHSSLLSRNARALKGDQAAAKPCPNNHQIWRLRAPLQCGQPPDISFIPSSAGIPPPPALPSPAVPRWARAHWVATGSRPRQLYHRRRQLSGTAGAVPAVFSAPHPTQGWFVGMAGWGAQELLRCLGRFPAPPCCFRGRRCWAGRPGAHTRHRGGWAGLRQRLDGASPPGGTAPPPRGTPAHVPTSTAPGGPAPQAPEYGSPACLGGAGARPRP